MAYNRPGENVTAVKLTIKYGLFAHTGAAPELWPIRARVSYGGQRVDLRLGYSIEPEKWDALNQRALPNIRTKNGQTAGDINRALLDCETKVNAIFERYKLLEGREPSPAELREAFNESIGRAKPKPEEKPAAPFLRAFSEFVASMGEQNSWQDPTYTKFNALKKHLLKYDPNISFENLSREYIQGFVASMQKEGLRNTTISKNLGFLRWFLRWAYYAGYNPTTVHETYKPRLKGTDGNSKEVIYLEWEELMKLYNFEFPEKYASLPFVRDVFCFCCFTGLRYSDVAKLQRVDVKENYIEVVTKKTVDGLRIELNKYSRAILKKYENIGFPGGLALPVISNVKMNEHLKLMGKLAGLDAPQRIVFFVGNIRHEEVLPKYALLTTHCGRRTFVVNALRLEIPAEVVMKWTGHSTFRSMAPYVKIVDRLKESEMEKFNTFAPEEKKPGK